jgi:Antirestriction protein (ArdA)
MTDVNNLEDILDVRDIIARFEELETERDELKDAAEDEDADDAAREAYSEWNADNEHEFDSLRELLDEMKGYSGDEQWRGDWYPITLVRDSYFQNYAEELADDIGAINDSATWPHTCIDWERAARELQMDYSSVEFGSVTYWYR